MRTRDRARKVQTTLRLPKALYEQAKAAIEAAHTEAETINDFVIAALQLYTKILSRKRIDAAAARVGAGRKSLTTQCG